MNTQRTIDTVYGPVHIRTTHEADAEQFRDLRLTAIRNHQATFTSDYGGQARASLERWRERVIEGAGDNDESAIAVAEAQGQLVGMAGIRRGGTEKTEHNAIIWGVYVRDGWRGARLTEALFDRCVAWARQHGVTVVKLTVLATNAAAIRAYLRYGFSIYGVEPDSVRWEGVSYDELLMAKRLPDEARTTIHTEG